MFDHLEDELNAFRKHVITEARKNLTRNKKNASKTLYRELDSTLNISRNSFELAFLMPEYGVYQDEGVNGKVIKWGSRFSYKDKMPPSTVFEDWIKRKGIKGRDSNGRFITHKSLSYLISRSIYRNGIKPSLFFTRPFELAFRRLSDDVVEAFGLDIDDFLQYTLNRFDR